MIADNRDNGDDDGDDGDNDSRSYETTAATIRLLTCYSYINTTIDIIPHFCWDYLYCATITPRSL